MKPLHLAAIFGSLSFALTCGYVGYLLGSQDRCSDLIEVSMSSDRIHAIETVYGRTGAVLLRRSMDLDDPISTLFDF